MFGKKYVFSGAYDSLIFLINIVKLEPTLQYYAILYIYVNLSDRTPLHLLNNGPLKSVTKSGKNYHVPHNAVKVNDIDFIRPRERSKRVVELHDQQISPFRPRQRARSLDNRDESRGEIRIPVSEVRTIHTYVLATYSRREFCNKAVKDGAP